MLAIIACLLCQIEPAKTEPISLAEFVGKSTAQQAAVFDGKINELQEQVRRNKGNGAVLFRLKKELAATKSAKAKAPFPPRAASLDLSAARPGDAGSFVYYGFGGAPTARSARTLQVLNGLAICESEKVTFAVTGLDTSSLVDEKPIDMNGIWQVSGTFTYTTVLGASRKIPVLTPWKHTAAFGELTAADKPTPAKSK